jgi:DNA-binding FadR family transcriptional regulator
VKTAMKASLAIAADFRERIVTGELQAGDSLPVEDTLMVQLGASRSVVREALRILETEGLVVVRRGIGGGPRVRHPTISDAARAMSVYLQIGDISVADVWEARDRIIAGAVERLALHHSEEDAATFGAAAAALKEVVGDLDAYYPRLIEVGETVVRLAGNATEYVLVVALRHIIATELERATQDIVDVDYAVAREDDVARAWQAAARHVRGGPPRRGPPGVRPAGRVHRGHSGDAPQRKSRRHLSQLVGPSSAPGVGFQVCSTMPPSTTMTCPVIQRPAGETKSNRAPQSSVGSPRARRAARVFIIW